MVDLRGLGGTCTLAFNLNEQGQVVGSSNLTGDERSRAFLWENGELRDLGGSLGGKFTGAESINEAGAAVGFATLPGDAIFHATLWRHVGKLKNLGVLGNDVCSYAIAINSREQVVGSSLETCGPDTGNVRAFLWERGIMFDLNTVIPKGSPLNLQFVETINDRGEIAGTGMDSGGNTLAFLLVPCEANSPDECKEEFGDVDKTAQQSPPSLTQQSRIAGRRSVRRILQPRLGPGPHILTP